MQVLRQPRRRVRQVGKAVLDHRGLRVHAHDLVRLRLIAGDGVEAFLHQLDQLGPRGLVLDQHDTGPKARVLLARRALQFRVFHAPTQYVEEIKVLAQYPPTCADTEIAELARPARGVQAQVAGFYTATRPMPTPRGRLFQRRPRFPESGTERCSPRSVRHLSHTLTASTEPFANDDRPTAPNVLTFRSEKSQPAALPSDARG